MEWMREKKGSKHLQSLFGTKMDEWDQTVDDASTHTKNDDNN